MTNKRHIAIILYIGQRGKVYEKTILDRLRGVKFQDIIKCSNILDVSGIHLLDETLNNTSVHGEWKYEWCITEKGKQLRKQLIEDGWYLADA